MPHERAHQTGIKLHIFLLIMYKNYTNYKYKEKGKIKQMSGIQIY